MAKSKKKEPAAAAPAGACEHGEVLKLHRNGVILCALCDFAGPQNGPPAPCGEEGCDT